MIDFNDLDSLPGASAPSSKGGSITENAHVVNGGTALFPCPGCNGTGSWKGRGPCFKCNGKGKVSKGVVAAAKAKVTRAANDEQWASDHADEITFLRNGSDWSDFYRSLYDQFCDNHRLSEGQIAAVRNGMAKAAARKAEKAAAREAGAQKVDVSAIEALFATAKSKGLKKPKFRAAGITISLAPATGKNAGALYVKSGDDYMGKVSGGRFFASSAASPEIEARLLEVAADPLGQAVLYGQQTGRCSCCGAELTNKVSIEAGIGPICASNWGL